MCSRIDSFSNAIRRFPPSIEKGLQGKNTVEFRILRDGNIQKDSLKMIASSQKSELDTASLGAVREAAPFGHLPENFSEPFIVLRMTFYYNLLPSTLISRLTGNLGTGTEKVCGLFAFYS